MRVLFDVNVIVDMLGRTESYPESLIAVDVALVRDFQTSISIVSTPTIHYVLTASKLLDRHASLEALQMLPRLFDILDCIPADYQEALLSDMGDFEDALLALSAKRHKTDIIVTRNKRDFAHSPVPTLTPTEFIDLYQPESYSYEMVDW